LVKWRFPCIFAQTENCIAEESLLGLIDWTKKFKRSRQEDDLPQFFFPAKAFIGLHCCTSKIILPAAQNIRSSWAMFSASETKVTMVCGRIIEGHTNLAKFIPNGLG